MEINLLDDENQKSGLETFIIRLREEFRAWYGLLSVEELVQNKELVEEIYQIEKLFSRQGV